MIWSPPFVDYRSAMQVNPFMQGQAALGYNMNLPQYGAMRGAQSRGLVQQLEGESPEAVIREIWEQAAARGIGTGSPGSPNANAAGLRLIGLNALDMIKQAREGLNTAIAQTPVAELWNPMSLYVPERLGQQTLEAARAGESGSRRRENSLAYLYPGQSDWQYQYRYWS